MTEPALQKATPAELLRVAVEGNADLDKLEKLMELQERFQASEARSAYYTALADFQAACPRVDRADKAHTNKYAKLERIVATVRDTLKGCGLTYRFEIADIDGGALRVRCVITHTQGHSEAAEMTAPADGSGSKNVIQARASTVTYLQRYTLCGALGIVTADEDTDGGKPAAVITPEQVKALRAALDESTSTELNVLQFGACKTLEAFPQSKLSEAMQAINAHKKGE